MAILKKKPKPAPEAKMPMTSMIDIVFLLIIFFMLVTEMTKMELEEITLPTAQTGISEIKDPKNRLIINITWNREREESRMIIMRRQHDINALRTRLRVVADAQREASVGGAPPAAEVLIKIRADAYVPYEKVMVVMAQCARVYIYKISFAVKESTVF